MPELPEVEAVVRRLREQVAGARIHSVHVERRSTIAPQHLEDFEVLVGKSIAGVRRRAKYIFVELSGGALLQVHLRMTGNLYVLPDYRLLPAAVRFWLRLKDGRALVFRDGRALGKVHLATAADVAQLEASLGPEPLDAAFTPAVLKGILKGLRGPVKPALMDQKRIAGIGNIYASEALWRARIDPRIAAGAVPARKVTALHDTIVKVLELAAESAYAEYSEPGTIAEAEGFDLAVYGRKGQACPRCGKAIERIVQAGRSTFFCAGCQA
ncbi:bifunctional DNA-formamidopyrimidine glycosylase/DNA-(apurinic or apyrimidinic site) lyase [Bryobacter aggregatus]|uniref:bifunctional DNA-formamidopyrimidine glycosylase/DNA-(apurinic or apyrimidinic site) lyase n=1 Tax=Bryobacter aggregatus TaxID=360054 RepID=UPI0004E115FF|nr:bifunctional DNA-formamidopyrimidine glycosylase/DNA-(apurinic or apyrimidinic site) lyase [Bryobacter aggregatus]